MYLIVSPLKTLMKREHLSERGLSEDVGISRSSLRKILRFAVQLNIQTINQVARYFAQNLLVITYPSTHSPVCSALATSYNIKIDGFNSWKIHIMDMVDEFRKTLDMRLIILPPEVECSPKIHALLAATIITLCEEVDIPPPEWTFSTKPLDSPWFVSGMESLKASAILESPFGFRSKNIFVHKKFLERA